MYELRIELRLSVAGQNYVQNDFPLVVHPPVMRVKDPAEAGSSRMGASVMSAGDEQLWAYDEAAAVAAFPTVGDGKRRLEA